MVELVKHQLPARMRMLLTVYLSRQEGGGFSLALGVGGGLALAGPVLVGLALGHLVLGVIAGLGGWLVYLGEPVGDSRTRIIALSRRVLLCSLATWLGALTAGALWTTVPLIAISALLVPLRWFGPTPMLCLVFGATMGGLTPTQHGWTFLAGAAWAAVLLLIPLFGGRHDAPAPRPDRAPLLRQARTALSKLGSAVREGSPEFRYAVRLAVSFSVSFIGVEYIGLPHANWVLTGIVTTVRPTWDATTERIVKRMGGQILGAALSGVLLALCAGLPPAVLAVVTGLCGALARPARRVNYGFWPIFGVPAMLLLVSFESPEGWTDAAERVGDNLLGAVIAALAMLLLWPPHEEPRIATHRDAPLNAHARQLADHTAGATRLADGEQTRRTPPVSRALTALRWAREDHGRNGAVTPHDRAGLRSRTTRRIHAPPRQLARERAAGAGLANVDFRQAAAWPVRGVGQPGIHRQRP